MNILPLSLLLILSTSVPLSSCDCFDRVVRRAASGEFAAAAEMVYAGFFDEHLTLVLNGVELAEFNELVNDFLADAHVLGRLADGHQRQGDMVFFDDNAIVFFHL